MGRGEIGGRGVAALDRVGQVECHLYVIGHGAGVADKNKRDRSYDHLGEPAEDEHRVP